MIAQGKMLNSRCPVWPCDRITRRKPHMPSWHSSTWPSATLRIDFNPQSSEPGLSFVERHRSDITDTSGIMEILPKVQSFLFLCWAEPQEKKAISANPIAMRNEPSSRPGPNCSFSKNTPIRTPRTMPTSRAGTT